MTESASARRPEILMRRQGQARVPLHARPVASPNRWATLRLLTPFFFLVGSVLHWDVYDSITPTILMLALAAPVWLALLLLRSARSDARNAYAFLIAAYWMVAGFVVWLQGPTETVFNSFNDDEKFYTLVATGMVGDTLDEIRLQTEGSLAVFLWSYLYSYAEALAMPRWPVIGITLNITAVACCCAITVMTVERLCGIDRNRSFLIAILYLSCGLFLLSATHHLRDGYPTLAITALGYLWIVFLSSRTAKHFVFILAASPFFAFVLYYLRTEFVFIPIIFAAAAFGALVVSRDIRNHERGWVNTAVLIGTLGLAVTLSVFGSEATQQLRAGSDSYAEFAAEAAKTQSLGMALFVNQPMPIKMLIGPLYVMFMPLPIWSGFMVGSGYYVFKQIGAVWFYFMGPAFGAAILYLLQSPRARIAPIIFMLSGFAGFLLLIGVTSAESRHVGAFIPLLIAAIATLLPDSAYRLRLRSTFFSVLLAIALAHIAWLAIKGT